MARVRMAVCLALAPVAVVACTGGGGDDAAGACEGLEPVNTGTFDLAGRPGAIVHVPLDYDPDDATPLVLVFHGGTDRPEGAEKQTGFSTLADQEGFIAVYPIAEEPNPAVGRVWSLTPIRQPTELDEQQQAMPSWLTEGVVEGNPDITYVEELLDELDAMLCVDAGRVYATGHSMGGGFASTLGCTLDDRIAAIGPVSVWNVVGLGECEPARSVPVMGMFSVDDSGYEGGEWTPVVDLESYPDFGERWAGLNTCSSGPEPDGQSGDASSQQWSGCSAPVVMWTLADGGHTWPGSTELGASTDIDATTTLWQFFTEHQLPVP